MFKPQFYSSLCFANGDVKAPGSFAKIKSIPSDFKVSERLGFDCSGEGEHVWLNVTKTDMHTTQVSKDIAKYAGVAAKHVGFSGMKDHRAVTDQWFSIWLPGIKDSDLPNWQALNGDGLHINEVIRHHRKLKRGTHLANEFEIQLIDFCGDTDEIGERISNLTTNGVPNYFGEQRFGFSGNNLNKALDWFEKEYKIKQQNKRSLLLSSARSWLFNLVLSTRLKNNDWLSVYEKEPLNLSGSKSYFVSEDKNVDQKRLMAMDVHTTGPLWGRGIDKVLPGSSLRSLEESVLVNHPLFLKGLEQAGLSYDRRPLRFVPQNLIWNINGNRISLKFSLSRGQYATAFLRELVQAKI